MNLARFKPRSIRAGVLMVMAAVLVISQIVAVGFYGWDRARLERQVEGQDLQQRIDMAKRAIAAAPRGERGSIIEALRGPDMIIQVAPLPGAPPAPPAPLAPHARPSLPSLPSAPALPSVPVPPSGPAAPHGPDALGGGEDPLAARLQAEIQAEITQAFEAVNADRESLNAAIEQTNAMRDRLNEARAAIQDQIRDAERELREHMTEAREQIREAMARVREAQREAARETDPEARAAALEVVRDAQADADEAARELERLSRQTADRMVKVSMALPTGDLMVQVTARPIHPQFNYARFFAVFAISATVILGLGLWAARSVTAPLSLFGAAAERLGRNVDAPPLPENGPEEVRKAAAAFNGMQARIKRFIADRTTMLAAISHDLRTPLTRMRLRVEFVTDDEDRAKLIADLDEMEAMIAEALAFARNEAETEAPVAVDLQVLAERIAADQVAVGALVAVAPGPEALIPGRPSALKRALTNLVRNAVLYGGSARISVETRAEGFAIHVDDDGPGLDEADLERVFTPFLRLEESRNKASGGVGLGLSVARSTARAHGGDITLANRPEGGLRATLFLPAPLAAA